MKTNGIVTYLRLVMSFVFADQALAVEPLGYAGRSTTNVSHFTFKPGARVAVDAGMHVDDDTETKDVNVRRIRLSAEGGLTEQWGYEIASDVQNRKLEFKDAYGAYNGNRFTAYVGQHRQPLGLEAVTSSKNTSFLERALPYAFVPSRSMGGSVHASNEYLAAAIGAFAGTINDYASNESDDSTDVAARLVFHHTAGRIYHVGVAGSRSNDDAVRYSSLPESELQDVKYVNTGKIQKVDSLRTLGFELAFVDGPSSVQAEYIQTRIGRGRVADVVLDGFYIQTSWFLTGESRSYQSTSGAFGAVRPIRRWGALEAALRYSELDLNDGAIQGGAEHDLTFGLNWYVSRHARVTANYTIAHPRVPRSGDDDAGIWLHIVAARLEIII